MTHREKKPPLVLGLESSCDETAAAVVRNGREVLSSVISSQVSLHARFGGVVPEIASRQHLQALFPLVSAALAESGVSLRDLDAVAVTRTPGLVGALLVGLSAAKALAYALDIPVVGVNHLQAHMLAVRLLPDPPDFPFLGLIVSGGHTALYAVEAPDRFKRLGATRDDAAGEALDKFAKLCGLGYPGGVEIERLARTGDPDAVAFPRALPRKDTLDFSFSGLKTAAREHVRSHGASAEDLPDLCASLQEAVVDALARKTALALRRTGLTRLVLAGGVAANGRLRERMAETARANGAECYVPDRIHCTDNAAMVAVAGTEALRRGVAHGLDLNASPSEELA